MKTKPCEHEPQRVRTSSPKKRQFDAHLRRSDAVQLASAARGELVFTIFGDGFKLSFKPGANGSVLIQLIED
jgi:hypothetical protein